MSIVLVVCSYRSNGLNQVKFNDASSLDGLIVAKLDGTAKTLAISNKAYFLPIYRIGVGESIGTLQTFDARSFCEALVGEEFSNGLQDRLQNRIFRSARKGPSLRTISVYARNSHEIFSS